MEEKKKENSPVNLSRVFPHFCRPSWNINHVTINPFYWIENEARYKIEAFDITRYKSSKPRATSEKQIGSPSFNDGKRHFGERERKGRRKRSRQSTRRNLFEGTSRWIPTPYPAEGPHSRERKREDPSTIVSIIGFCPPSSPGCNVSPCVLRDFVHCRALFPPLSFSPSTLLDRSSSLLSFFLPPSPFSPSISLRLETAHTAFIGNIGTPFSADGPARTSKRSRA